MKEFRTDFSDPSDSGLGQRGGQEGPRQGGPGALCHQPPLSLGWALDEAVRRGLTAGHRRLCEARTKSVSRAQGPQLRLSLL